MLQEIKCDNSNGGCCAPFEARAHGCAAALAMHWFGPSVSPQVPRRKAPPAPAWQARRLGFDRPSASHSCSARDTDRAARGRAPAHCLPPSIGRRACQPLHGNRLRPSPSNMRTQPTPAAKTAAKRPTIWTTRRGCCGEDACSQANNSLVQSDGLSKCFSSRTMRRLAAFNGVGAIFRQEHRSLVPWKRHPGPQCFNSGHGRLLSEAAPVSTLAYPYICLRTNQTVSRGRNSHCRTGVSPTPMPGSTGMSAE